VTCRLKSEFEVSNIIDGLEVGTSLIVLGHAGWDGLSLRLCSVDCLDDTPKPVHHRRLRSNTIDLNRDSIRIVMGNFGNNQNSASEVILFSLKFRLLHSRRLHGIWSSLRNRWRFPGSGKPQGFKYSLVKSLLKALLLSTSHCHSSDGATVQGGGHVKLCCNLQTCQLLIIITLHRLHEMQTIVTDVRGVCLSACLSRGLNRRRRVQCTPRAVCAGSFGAAFAKCLWPLVKYYWSLHVGLIQFLLFNCVSIFKRTGRVSKQMIIYLRSTFTKPFIYFRWVV